MLINFSKHDFFKYFFNKYISLLKYYSIENINIMYKFNKFFNSIIYLLKFTKIKKAK